MFGGSVVYSVNSGLLINDSPVKCLPLLGTAPVCAAQFIIVYNLISISTKKLNSNSRPLSSSSHHLKLVCVKSQKLR